jgi:translation initiation factor 5
MASQFVNIGGKSDDASYRYKMPKMVTKIEGRGNGIKTVIVNMVDIAKALRVHPSYPTKYLGIELGAQSKFGEDERAIVNGAHQQPDLAVLLNKFISTFVLCPRCKYPEITLEVKHNVIRYDCAACGQTDKLQTAHKLTQHVLKYPPNNSKKLVANQSGAPIDKKPDGGDDSSAAAAASASNADTLPRGQLGRPDSESDQVVWQTAVSKEAVEQRKKIEMGEMTHNANVELQAKIDALVAQAEKAKEESANKQTPAVLVLKLFLIQKERSVDEIFLELKRLQLSRDIDDVSRVKLLFDALLDTSDPKTIVDQFALHANLFKKLTQGRGSQSFIWNIEELVALKEAKLLPRLGLILKKLYDLDVLEEEAIVNWYESPPESNHLVHDKEVGSETRAKARPFYEWLKSQDDDADD